MPEKRAQHYAINYIQNDRNMMKIEVLQTT